MVCVHGGCVLVLCVVSQPDVPSTPREGVRCRIVVGEDCGSSWECDRLHVLALFDICSVRRLTRGDGMAAIATVAQFPTFDAAQAESAALWAQLLNTVQISDPSGGDQDQLSTCAWMDVAIM